MKGLLKKVTAVLLLVITAFMAVTFVLPSNDVSALGTGDVLQGVLVADKYEVATMVIVAIFLLGVPIASLILIFATGLYKRWNKLDSENPHMHNLIPGEIRSPKKDFVTRVVVAVFALILAILVFCALSSNAGANAIDEIEEYVITVDVNPDGSLNMDYKIRWHIVSNNGDKPLTWVKIGIPNSNIDNIEAVSSNIKEAKYYYDFGDYIRIDFDQSYTDGDVFEFEYKFTQYQMFAENGDTTIYSFTPGWFDTIPVDRITVRWDAEDILRAGPETDAVDGYMVWEKSLAPGEKMPLAIVYDSSVYDFQEHKVFHFKFSPIVAIIVLICIFLPLLFTVVLLGTYSRFFGYRSDDRYLHRRHHFGGGGFGGGFGGGCACACACACAGGGRAGCSSKDFYGTKLESARVRARLKAQLKK